MSMIDRSGQPRSDKEIQEAINAVKEVIIKHALTLPPLLVVHSGIILDALREVQYRRRMDHIPRNVV